MRTFQSLTGALLLCFFCGSNSYAGIRDTDHQIDEVTVVGNRFHHFNTGHTCTTIDSMALKMQPSANLSDLLTQQSLLQVSPYGAGSSSISARGTGDKRTPIIWNGFNIQSIVSAGCDVVQLPGFFFEDLKVQMGGSSALFGSGAAGGLLFLNNKLPFNGKPHFEVNTSTGSFGSFASGAKATFGNSFYSGSLKVFQQIAENNFPYKATSGNKLIDTTQTNAQAKMYGVMLNNIFRINAAQQIKVNGWYNDNNKNIAPTVSDIIKSKSSDANQHDKFAAGTAEWSYLGNQFSLWARSGLFYSTLDYVKPSAKTISSSEATWSVNEVEGNLSLGNIRLNAGLNETMEFCKSNSFTDKKERYRSAIFTSVSYNLPQIGFKYSLSGRGEMINGKTIPLTYSTGIEQQFFNALTIKGNIAKNYRVPTFNDLYYIKGTQYGNPDLKPETGMQYEAGVEYAKKFGASAFSLGVNGFYSDMKDWMNWVQLENKDYTVQNIDKAKIKGIESYASAGISVGEFQMNLRGMFTRMDAKDGKTDKILANVPKNKTVSSISLKYKQSALMYQHTWVGTRYSNTSNSQAIDAYTLGNLIFSQSAQLNGTTAGINFGLYNMWNKDYMILQNYPMPGRNFRLGLSMTF